MTNLLDNIDLTAALTNINAEALSHLDREQAEGIAKGLFSEYGWIFVAGVIAVSYTHLRAHET